MQRIFVLLSFICLNSFFAEAQDFKAGDRVEADINMSSSPEYQKWRRATITKVEMWNGQVSAYAIRTDEGADVMIGGKYLKKIAEEHKKNDNPDITGQKTNNIDRGVGNAIDFKVGDRVEVDKIMAKDPKDARWGKATVKAVDPENGRYVVRLDENFIDMSILIRSGKNWIRHLNDGSTTPQQASCPFNEPPGTVTKTAKASAALFKRVIYDWQNSIKRGSRLGITFEKFEMGSSFKNIITAKGRLLDFVPTNAIVYPVKTKQIICEDHTTLIRRTLYEVEYACYKNEYGDWVCKNGSPTKMESKSIYKE